VLEAVLGKPDRIHAEFIFIHRVVIADRRCRRAIGFTNSTAIVYANAF
jgi:hypothetical protein